MATKKSQPAAAETQQSASTSKKRKPALAEIEVDLSLPEPPSKKARRALKKGKTLPSKPASSDDEDESKPAEEDKDNGAKDGKKKKERSPHGVWIGNLPFTTSKADLRKWLVDNSGGAITDDAITRVHMPTTKPAVGTGAAAKKTPENRGFAYVDFASFEANVAAIALSETELNGRKLLIKDSKSFEGRPKVEETPAATNGDSRKAAGSDTKAPASASTKIFVGNLAFNTTEDDLYAHFEKCGKIRWVKVATFEDSGKCKGYGWVNFEEPDAAAWAVKGFVKVRETVETLEDFMDEDSKTADGEAPNKKTEKDYEKQDDNNNRSSSGSDGEQEEEEEEGEEEEKEKEQQQQGKKPKPGSQTKPSAVATVKEPARTRTRKWWVNQLLGRNLKIELAEDDQTRYHKRFGKGAAKQQKRQQQSGAARAQGGGDEDKKEDKDKDNGMEKERQKEKGINYHKDISVARLTGAAVAHQGKKITFD